MFKRTNKTTTETTWTCDSILETCDFAITEEGSLRIRPLGTTLDTDVLTRIIARLSLPGLFAGLKEVVFDLRCVETLGPRWTVVLAQILDFARHASVRCRLVALNRQPAAVAALYRRSPELMNFLAA